MPSLSARDVSHIGKFDGAHFSFWKLNIRTVLERHRLYGIANGEIPCPVANIPNVITGVVRNARAISKWKDKDSIIRLTLLSTLETQIAMTLQHCTTGAEMWTRLVIQYEQAAIESKSILFSKFGQYEYVTNHTMMQHISALEGLFVQLQALNCLVDPGQLVGQILMTLPEEFDGFLLTWNGLAEADKTIETLTTKLLLHESLLAAQTERRKKIELKETALLSKRGEGCKTCGLFNHKTENCRKRLRDESGNRRQNKRAKRLCTYCGFNNHEAKDCYKRLREEKQDEQKSLALKSNSNHGTQPHGSRDNHRFDDPTYAFPASSTCNQRHDAAWFLDSGASQHMTDNRNFFSSFEPVSSYWPVTGIADSLRKVEGVGEVHIRTKISGEWKLITLKGVLYVPGLKMNLISVGTAADNGVISTFKKDKALLTRDNLIIAIGRRVGRELYLLDIEAVSPRSQASLSASDTPLFSTPYSLDTWHQRLGHIHHRAIENLIPHVIGLRLKSIDDAAPPCVGCAKGKSHRLPFPSGGRTRATGIGKLIHSDVEGPLRPVSASGARYFVLFKDDFSGFRAIYLMKQKSEVPDFFRQFAARLLRVTGHHIDTLRSDGGGEFVGGDFAQYLAQEGIRHEMSAPHSPQQNGVSERENRTIMEATRSMLHGSGLPLYLWDECVKCAAYILNRVLSRSTIQPITPYEAWYGTKPNVSHFIPFGCRADVHIPKADRKKLDAKSELCYFVSYCETQKAYRFWSKSSRKIITSRDATFHEFSQSPASLCASDSDDNEVSEQLAVQAPEPEGRLSQRERKQAKPRSALISDATFVADSTLIDEEPTHYADAIASDDSALWRVAMETEIAGLHKNNTWSLVERPKDRKAIRCRWTYKIKRNVDGSIERRKGRLVAKGFEQKLGIDYEKTFSPVVKHDSLRCVLAIAAAEDLELMQLDVTTAFLYGELEEELYLEQPQGFVVPGKEDWVYLLHKCLYGLKQSSRVWNKKFDMFLQKFGLVASEADPCVYYLRRGSDVIIVAIWVDDGLIAGSSLELVHTIITYLKEHFDVTSRPADMFVGLHITRDRPKRHLHLSQPTYITRMLSRFGMQDCRPQSVPADPSAKLVPISVSDAPAGGTYPFKEAVGSLMYAANTTRPDIKYAVGQVAKFAQNPSPAHWSAVKLILSYLKGTIDYGIRFSGSSSSGVLSAYSDADYAGCLQTRRSTTGYVLLLSGGPVAWTSRRQQGVATSTTESEYTAAFEATKETVWVRNLLRHVGTAQSSPTELFCDNQSAIKMVHNPEFHSRTKHIDVHLHFIREKQDDKTIGIQYISTHDQLADIFTKPLSRITFEKLRAGISVSQPIFDSSTPEVNLAGK